MKENPRREAGDTADKLKRGLQKGALQKGVVQKLQERQEQGPTVQVCSLPRLHTKALHSLMGRQATKPRSSLEFSLARSMLCALNVTCVSDDAK